MFDFFLSVFFFVFVLMCVYVCVCVCVHGARREREMRVLPETKPAVVGLLYYLRACLLFVCLYVETAVSSVCCVFVCLGFICVLVCACMYVCVVCMNVILTMCVSHQVYYMDTQIYDVLLVGNIIESGDWY